MFKYAIDLGTDKPNDSYFIPLVDFLNQLNEECAELIQASSKVIRKCGNANPTPKTWVDVESEFIEELADVYNLLTILMEENSDWVDEINETAKEKRQRWIMRLTAEE